MAATVVTTLRFAVMVMIVFTVTQVNRVIFTVNDILELRKLLFVMAYFDVPLSAPSAEI